MEPQGHRDTEKKREWGKGRVGEGVNANAINDPRKRSPTLPLTHSPPHSSRCHCAPVVPSSPRRLTNSRRGGNARLFARFQPAKGAAEYVGVGWHLPDLLKAVFANPLGQFRESLMEVAEQRICLRP